MDPLDAFRAAAPGFAGAADAEALLGAVYQRAQAAWPGVSLDAETFYAHLGARLGEATGGLAAALAAAHTDDLYLACACLQGGRAALDAFTRAAGDAIEASLGRFDLSQADKQDLGQQLRVGFFVKKSLAGYSGKGALRGWARSAATRAALDLVEARKLRPDNEEDILGGMPATGDLELDLVRRRFSDEFKRAFAAAVASLAPADRAVLAQHYIDDLSIDQLAVVLGVHRANAARRIVKIRGSLLEGTRARLLELLHIDTATLDSLMRVAESRLQVSVFRLLRS